MRLRLLQLLVHVGDRLPVRASYFVADIAATLAWYASGRLRRVTRDHMRHVLPTDTRYGTIDRAAVGSVRSAAHYYVDFARYAHLDPEFAFDEVESIDGVEALYEAYDRGRGVILASAHLGNPEFIAQALGPLFDTVVLTEPLKPRELHDFVHQVRAHSGVRFVAADRPGLRIALRHLRCGGVLGVLLDRDVLGTGELFPFFGERAPMPAGGVELAWMTGAALVVGTVIRSAPGRYRVSLQEVPLPTRVDGSGSRDADIELGMRRSVQALEESIRSAPEQWFALSPVWTEPLATADEQSGRGD